jgi:hypothetical protein
LAVKKNGGEAEVKKDSQAISNFFAQINTVKKKRVIIMKKSWTMSE